MSGVWNVFLLMSLDRANLSLLSCLGLNSSQGNKIYYLCFTQKKKAYKYMSLLSPINQLEKKLTESSKLSSLPTVSVNFDTAQMFV